jgi:hypothetical protein
VDGDVVDADVALDEKLLDVPEGQAVAEVPVDGEGDDVPGVAEAGEGEAPRRGG